MRDLFNDLIDDSVEGSCEGYLKSIQSNYGYVFFWYGYSDNEALENYYAKYVSRKKLKEIEKARKEDEDDTFSGWSYLPGSTPSAPTLVSEGTKLALVVRGGNDYVYFRTYDTVTQVWSNWHVLPTATTSERPAAALVNNKLHIVVRGITPTDTTLWHATVSPLGTDFSGWTALSGSTPSAPVLARMETSNELAVVARGSNDVIYLNKWNGLTWQGWTAVPSGSTSTSPAAAILGNTIHFIVVGMDGSTLWYGSMNLATSGFSGWTPLSGSTPSAPTLTR